MTNAGPAFLGRAIGLLAMTALLSMAPAQPANACTCVWGGAFLTVAPKAEIIVRVRIRDYHGQSRGPAPPAMDVAVLEQLKGPEVAREIRIWGDSGVLCRPYVSQFPRGTDWLLAIYPQRRERPGAED
jgi:hypothetical protein